MMVQFSDGMISMEPVEGDRVRGVLLWNVWDSVPAARALLAMPGPFKPTERLGRLKQG